jgi:Asparagine synthase.
MVKADLLSPLLIKDNIFWHLDEPRASPNLYINWNLHQCAKKNGVKVMLNGFDGDTTISHGERYAVEYFLSLRLLKAIQGMYYRSKRINLTF